ncbi:MAG: AI-2E family transporter [Chloroflexi bacterium]|jgi:predicted PurR-regulated permease PerM|nr:AI-2E family transporter [Chloroflexota bacterium]
MPSTLSSSTPAESSVDEGETTGVPVAPTWLSHLAAISWRVLAIAGLAVVVVLLAAKLITVVASVLIAGIVTVAFIPLQAHLGERGWSRARSAVVVWLIATAIIVAAIGLVVIAFVPEVVAVVAAMADGLAALREQLEAASLPPAIAAHLEDLAAAVQAWIAASVSTVATLAGTVGTIALLSFFLTFFALKDGDRGIAWALQFVTGWRRDAISGSGAAAVDHLGGYLRGIAVLAAVRALLVLVFLLVLGIPHAGPLAAVVFLGGLVPYLGGLVAGALVLLVALASSGLAGAVLIFALIVATSLALDYILAPRLYGTAQRMHPAVAIVALVIGAATAGVLGLFVAVPIAAFGIAVAGSVIAALGDDPGAPPDETGFVPDWFDRLAQWSWRALVVLAFCAVIVYVSGQFPALVGAVVMAAVLAATFAPLVAMLLRRGWHPARAALAVTCGALGITLLILAATLLSLVVQADDIVAAGSGGAGILDEAAGGALGFLGSIVADLGGSLVATAASVAASLLGLALLVFLATALTYYFLRDGGAGWTFATRRMADWRRHEVDAAGSRAVTVLGGYMIGTGAISLFGAATQLLIMLVLGIPLALPLSVLSFFGGFIPYIGSLLTTALAFLVTVQVGSQQDIIVMGLFTIVFNIVQGNIVAPLVYGRAVNLHPAIVLAAIPAGGALAGVVGMFLAVPVLGVVATTWRTVVGVFGSGPPAAGVGTGDDDGPPAARPDPASVEAVPATASLAGEALPAPPPG